MPYSYDRAEVRGRGVLWRSTHAFVLYVVLLLYVTVMRAAPAARRPGIRSRVNVQIRFESGAAVLAGIARPDRSGGLSQALALLSVPHSCRSGRTGSDREP